MRQCAGLCSPRNTSCTNGDVWGDSAKVPAAVPAPAENRHRPKDVGLTRGPTQPEQRSEYSFLGFQVGNNKFTHGNKMFEPPEYVLASQFKNLNITTS